MDGMIVYEAVEWNEVKQTRWTLKAEFNQMFNLVTVVIKKECNILSTDMILFYKLG